MRTHLLAFALFLTACGVGELTTTLSEVERDDRDEQAQAFSSAQATLLEFEFDGELVVPGTVSTFSARSYIDQQLLFTIGHLNGNNSVGRLDKVTLTNVKVTAQTGSSVVTFHAKLPVAWGSKSNLPTSYAFTLPRGMGSAALEAFTTKYKAGCVDFGAHDVDAGSMWYYYRPAKSGCTLAAADVVKTTATATVSLENTTGKYPELHKVWEDQALNVVAIFGKYEDGATTSGDAGIAAFNAFVRAMKSELAAFSLVTTPASLPTDPGVATPDITFRATLANGKTVTVTALLVDNVLSAGPLFDARYEALSTRADLIAYNGHAGLGANVRALANKGSFVAGQYAIVFMNGCDTYAYVDGSLAQSRARINTDDPNGTKYLEIVTNGMPAFFQSMPNASLALVRGLMKVDAPLTYEQMFASVDRAQIITVTGEEDNVYYPGYQLGGFVPGFVQREAGSVDTGQELAYETKEVPAGKYTVTLSHDAAHPGGDVDLYVKVGQAPTATVYDCRPYLGGSAETCVVTLTAPAKIFVSVKGYTTGFFTLAILGEGGGSTPPPAWAGLDESSTVAKGAAKTYATPTLAAGRYAFTLSGTGDADLYVRSGVAPTTALYDCRPYKNGSAEECVLNLTTPAAVHVMVRGYAATSTFRIVGKIQ